LNPQPYIGRFAPTPSGELHFGSLVAALASFLDAKANNGKWHLRIDDVDFVRFKNTYHLSILKTLEQYGLHWDGPIIYQSNNYSIYESIIKQIKDHTYLCECSRKSLSKISVYPNNCRFKNLSGKFKRRCRVNTSEIAIHDSCQKKLQWNLATDIGDFIIVRADSVMSYHLSTVIDDILLNTSHIVRGVDLINETPKQIYLYSLLNKNPPQYAHIPIALNSSGQKLSKQSHAPSLSLNPQEITNNLIKVLKFLQQPIAPGLVSAQPIEIINHAIKNWQLVPADNYS